MGILPGVVLIVVKNIIWKIISCNFVKERKQSKVEGMCQQVKVNIDTIKFTLIYWERLAMKLPQLTYG